MQTRDAVEVPAAPPARRSRLALAAAVAAVALAAVAAAMTDVSVAGHWQGIFLLHGKRSAFELKDDLFLGDGSRLVTGVSFSGLRRMLAGAGTPSPGEPWLELEWDERGGSGIVRNHLGDGTELVTLFSRYEDSQGKTPQGLFVGGALPEIAADDAAQNESGMTFRDARGWHHVWCNVNEAIYDPTRARVSYPSEWMFLGSRVLIRSRERVVLESSHELTVGGVLLRMDRFAYFRAGKPWFKLGIRLVNAGEVVARYSYVYGDEPWVGDFGSAEGNVGWYEGTIVRRETLVDAVHNRWAGILDEDSGLANFASWIGGELPRIVYFSNSPDSFGARLGAPLASNEVFIGLQWDRRTLAPGEDEMMLLSFGLARVDPASGVPVLPEGAGPQ